MIQNKDKAINKIILSVIVLTYNQENTILQTLQSIIDQKTNFFFEILIGDDNSFDDTRGKIKQFMDVNLSSNNTIKLIHNKQNLGLVNNFQKIIYACSGKYISAIAGDDYWISNDKLQMQVDYLEANNDYGLVHTRFDILNMADNKIEKNDIKINEGKIFEQLLVANQIGALTAMYRHSLVIEAIESGIYKHGFLMEDYPLWLFIANKTKIGFINRITAVWRKSLESVSNSLSFSKNMIFDNSVLMVKSFFLKYSEKSDEMLQTLVLLHKRHLLLAYIHNIKIVATNSFSFLKKFKSLSFSDKKNYVGLKLHWLFKIFRFVKLNEIKNLKQKLSVL